MAAKIHATEYILPICVIFASVRAEFTAFNHPIPFVRRSTCVQSGTYAQFYDISKLECRQCSQERNIQSVSADGLSCICRPGYRYERNFGGAAVNCSACPQDQVASSTGYNCITCPTDAPYNNATGTCGACTDTSQISPERDLLGNLYGNINCQACVSGSQPGLDGTRCVKCTNVLPVTENNDCACGNQQIFTGGFCFPSADVNIVDDADATYYIPRTTDTPSAYLKEHLRAVYALCNVYKNGTACQVLGNLCVLTMYEYNAALTSATTTLTRACDLVRKIVTDERSFAPVNMPWLYYFSIAGEKLSGTDVLKDTYIQTQYTFDPRSSLQYRVATYGLDGTYKGITDVFNGKLQLCADSSPRLNAAYVFGTYYSQSCKIAAIDFWDRTKYPLEFYDLYLEISQNGDPELYPVPVLILNYRSVQDGEAEINRGGDEDNYLLVRRFFLVDNIATIPATAPNDPAPMVRYAKSISINVQLQTDTNQGVIYPPAIKIDYGTVSYTDAQNGQEVDISFNVDYSFTDTGYLRDFQIAIGTLSTLGVIYAGYRTWCWSKRAGRPTIDFPTIANFFFFCAGTLSNVFFVVCFGMSFYWLIFFKRQSVVYLVHPPDSSLEDWLGLFGAAFALKFLEVVHMIFMQCMIDVFFIDWERSRGVLGNSADTTKTKEVPVSIWRTYFVANEWNEIQAIRKINKTFQIFAVVFFLVVVGFENATTKDPDGSVQKDASAYKAEYSSVYRFGVSVLVYLIIGIVQWIFFTFIYERFFEDKVRQFVDLCSMSNISVFIMAHAQYGHYIHGRSVHGKADTNMKEMFEMMKKEESDMCSKRGLVENTDEQTFIMALPRKLRVKYEQVLLPAQLEGAGAGRMDGRGGGAASEKQVEAYATVNRFLSGFIDHSLRDMDYIIKDKTFLESVMDTEFYDTTETGIFYKDDGHSFDQVLFYGNEMTLLLFDVLTFCIADYIFTNYVVAGVITYLLSELVCLGRDAGGQKNLAKKTLVDERFLI